MFVIRPVREDDLTHLEEIAFSATLGLTSLPKNHAKLKAKLARALRMDGLYLFLLEDTATSTIAGCCGIISKIGTEEPVYFLKLETTVKGAKVLVPVVYLSGPTEIGSLFLKHAFRKEGLGKLLSFSRFLFIKVHRERFEPLTIAEMRGVIYKNMSSPLWSALGSRFFNAPFAEAMKLRDQGFFKMSDLIPEYPVYFSLLPKVAQKVVGKVHANTKPALQMLKKIGFSVTNEVDYFDGGPKIEAATDDIDVIKNSRTAPLLRIENISKGQLALVGTTTLDFRACQTLIQVEKNGIVLSKEASDALQASLGSPVIYYKLRKQ